LHAGEGATLAFGGRLVAPIGIERGEVKPPLHPDFFHPSSFTILSCRASKQSLHSRRKPQNGTYGILRPLFNQFYNLLIMQYLLYFRRKKIQRFQKSCSIFEQRVKITLCAKFGHFSA
jgi:hypothetical protein